MRKKKDLPKLNVPERFQPFEDVSLEIRHPEKYYIAANKEVIKNIKKSPWRIIFDFPKKKICKHKKKTAAVFEKYKKYNPTELRFLQLLLPGQTFFDVLMYNFNQAIENAFFTPDNQYMKEIGEFKNLAQKHLKYKEGWYKDGNC